MILGDAEGLGEVRAKELKESCQLLGIKKVQVENLKELPDSMSSRWNPEDAANIVQKYLETNPKIETVITFDAWGISGHPNHIDTHNGVRSALAAIPKSYELLELETVPLAFKYMGVLGIIYEMVDQIVEAAITKVEKSYEMDVVVDKVFVAHSSISEAYTLGFGAMKKHKSQLVWFRYLYLIFSRYMHVNVLKQRKQIETEQ